MYVGGLPVKKISEFIVSRRFMIMAAMLCITAVCAFLALRVKINYDMTKYLPDSSLMRTGMKIMEEQFPAMETGQTIRVMSEGLNPEEETQLLKALETIPNVSGVAHDDSESYKKGQYSLYVITTPCAYGTREEKAIEKSLARDFKDYGIVFKNDNAGVYDVPLWLLALAVGMLVVILILMCESWAESILFLVNIGIAVLINLGTNIVLGEISCLTWTMASILQLVLSIDYSIMLSNRYRQEKQTGLSKNEAMAAAVCNCFSSVSGSALTTAVGMLALAFMKFKIGFDLGFVLAKGVLISLLCVLTILPGIILCCDSLIEKTAKKTLHIPMDRAARFSFRFRFPLVICFIVMFAGFYILQDMTQISYNLEMQDPIAEVFTPDNPLVLVYENQDEEKVAALAEILERENGVTQVLGYPNLLGKQYRADEMADALNSLGNSFGVDMGGSFDFPPALLDLVYYHAYNGSVQPVRMGDFLQFLSDEILHNEAYAGLIDESMRSQAEPLSLFTSRESLEAERTSSELAAALGVDPSMIDLLFSFTGSRQDGSGAVMSLEALVNFLNDTLDSGGFIAGMISDENKNLIRGAKAVTDAVLSGEEYSAADAFQILGSVTDQLNPATMDLLYFIYAADKNAQDDRTLSIHQMFNHIYDSLLDDPVFSSFVDDSLRQTFTDTKEMLDDGVRMLKGEHYSRLIIHTSLPVESEETTLLIGTLTGASRSFEGPSYQIGNSAMSNEMRLSFDRELLTITLLTAGAIFLIVLFISRSIIVPALLVLIVQCGVFITVTVVGLQGYSIYFLALLIVECILMGATIDYGILFTGYYRENRRKMNPREALKAAYDGSIHTILTSGLIITIITGILGYTYSDPTVAEICRTISTGALSAVLLILFILPGMLAALDRFVSKRS